MYTFGTAADTGVILNQGVKREARSWASSVIEYVYQDNPFTACEMAGYFNTKEGSRPNA